MTLLLVYSLRVASVACMTEDTASNVLASSMTLDGALPDNNEGRE